MSAPQLEVSHAGLEAAAKSVAEDFAIFTDRGVRITDVRVAANAVVAYLKASSRAAKAEAPRSGGTPAARLAATQQLLHWLRNGNAYMEWPDGELGLDEAADAVESLGAEVASLRERISTALSVDGVNEDEAPVHFGNEAAHAWVCGYEAGQESVQSVLAPASRGEDNDKRPA